MTQTCEFCKKTGNLHTQRCPNAGFQVCDPIEDIGPYFQYITQPVIPPSMYIEFRVVSAYNLPHLYNQIRHTYVFDNFWEVYCFYSLFFYIDKIFIKRAKVRISIFSIKGWAKLNKITFNKFME